MSQLLEFDTDLFGEYGSLFVEWASQGYDYDPSTYDDDDFGSDEDGEEIDFTKSFKLVQDKRTISYTVEDDSWPTAIHAGVFMHLPTMRYFRVTFDDGSWDAPFLSAYEVKQVPSFDYVPVDA